MPSHANTSAPEAVSVADFEAHYEEISTLCRQNGNTVRITGNGDDVLTVMSAARYRKLARELELYDLIETGVKDIQEGQVVPAKEAIDEMIAKIENGTI